MPVPDLRIGITLGDPAGVGPEITLKALFDTLPENITPVVIGRGGMLSRNYPELFQSLEPAGGEPVEPGRKPMPGRRGFLVDVPSDLPMPTPGHGTVYTGAESRMYIDAAIGLWKARGIDAVVTGPVSKSFIEKSGCAFTGHTEYFAAAIGEDDPFMMMYSPDYRVILATTHIPLHLVEHSISEERLVKTMETGRRALAAIDGTEPRIAVAGLDPHCGDDGAIGDFDRRVTTEAVFRARELGMLAEGPFAADTLFLPERWKGFSLAVAQYHDQGLIPFKMLAFDTGVNVTLGISMVRTSVDHGTAYDIAGKGLAKHTSMVRAIQLAADLARDRGR